MSRHRRTCAPSSSDTARTFFCAAIAALTFTLASCDALTPAKPIAAPSTARVIAVVDGDTIDVETAAGAKERVRLIGLDAPEIARDGSQSDCYAHEARHELDVLLYGRDVELVTDATQSDRDKYGRLLRHVLVDGRSAALTAIAAGAAYEYTYAVPYEHQAAYIDAQAEAQRQLLGLWGSC